MSLCPSCNSEAGEVAKFCPACGASIVRMHGSDDYVGRIIAGKFRVEALLGEGGMGKVYRATQTSLDKTVVLKVLRQSLLSDERTVARFQREAKAASRLNHPNSISVIDFGQSEDGAMFIAMEYVSGQDLHQVLSTEGPLPEKRIVRIVSQVLSALAEAHAAGVIHRDLKPENIMVEQRRGEPDFVKVLDFGIAKITDSDGSEGQALTRAGFVCGTPEYMSPEQARGGVLDARSDLYAVGVICYQCATGQLPFDADSAVALATMHLTTQPVPPREKYREAAISEAMERLILRAMSKDPGERPQSAEEFRRALQSLGTERDLATQVVPQASHRRGARAPVAPEPIRTGRPSWVSAPGTDEPTALTTHPGPFPRGTLGTDPGDDKTQAASRVAKRPGLWARLPAAAKLAMGAGAAAMLLGAGTAYLVWGKAPQPVTFPAGHDGTKPAGDLDLAGDDGKAAVAAPRDAAKARDLLAQGDAAFAQGRLDEALALYRQSQEAGPGPAISKRLAMTSLARSDEAEAAKWLKAYLGEAHGTAEAEVIDRYLRSLEQP